MPAKLTPEQFFAKAKAKFGDKYDYSESIYTSWRGPITVRCVSHGVVTTTVRKHYESKAGGCITCTKLLHKLNSGSKAPTFSEWATKASRVHNSKFTYFEEDWNYNSKAKIKCPRHGIFFQRASRHAEGNGCHDCFKEDQYIPFETFVERARKVWGEQFNYDKSTFQSFDLPITITCIRHGNQFESTPYNHVMMGGGRTRKNAGCQKCKGEELRTPFAEFLSKARAKYGDTYKYKESWYSQMNAPCKVECKAHGVFNVSRAWDHAVGYSQCPECPRAAKPGQYSGTSKPESLIESLLLDLGLEFVREWNISELRGIRGGILRVDFALVEHKLFIEFDGPHHFKAVDYYDSDAKIAQERFLVTQEHDRRKNEWAEKNGWTMLRFSDKKNLESQVIEALSQMMPEVIAGSALFG